MITRILSKPLQLDKSFFLLGPRGTGKTRWVKTHLPQAVYIDLLITDLYAMLLANPSRVTEFIPPSYSGWVIIDEVQRVPALLNEVHRLIENQHCKFVLTGSSARSLRKKGVNLLAGRALMYHLHPLTVRELGEYFNFQQALQWGQLPALLTEPDPKSYLKAYVNIYLREEVLQEGLTRNLSGFSRFLEVASLSQGNVLNMSAIARESAVNQKVVINYFDILDDLLLGYRLPVFTKRAKRQIVQHPKFYFFDVGVYQILRPRGLLDSQEEVDGAALETLFLQELRALNDYYELDFQLYYWRTRAGVEVDFVVYGPKGFFAFEIKRGRKVSRQDSYGLRALQEEYPEVKSFLLYGGEHRQYYENITVLPFVEALKNLLEILNGTFSGN
jgi:uncharacterized protein